MKKRALSLMLCFLILIALVSCAENAKDEVKNVILLIDNIGEVSINSKDSIDKAMEAYNALDESDKKDVTNIDALYAAEDSFKIFIPAYNIMNDINEIGEITIESKATIDKITDQYNQLDQHDKKLVENIDELFAAQETVEQLIPKYIESQVENYRFGKIFDFNSLEVFVSEYYSYFNDEQIEIIGSAIGQSKIKELVISIIKGGMKNPDSFQLVDFDPGYITKLEDDLYFSYIDITFRGTNSFGAVVTESISGTIDFKVDFTNCTIIYVSSLFI